MLFPVAAPTALACACARASPSPQLLFTAPAMRNAHPHYAPTRSQHHGANLSAAIRVSSAPCAPAAYPIHRGARGHTRPKIHAGHPGHARHRAHHCTRARARRRCTRARDRPALFAPPPRRRLALRARQPCALTPGIRTGSRSIHRTARVIAVRTLSRGRASATGVEAASRRAPASGAARGQAQGPRRYVRQRRWERAQPQSSRPAQASGSRPRSQVTLEPRAACAEAPKGGVDARAIRSSPLMERGPALCPRRPRASPTSEPPTRLCQGARWMASKHTANGGHPEIKRATIRFTTT